MILLTGATGFAGRHIAESLLATGKQIRLFVRNQEAANHIFGNHPQISIAEGELSDVLSIESALEGISSVIHAAAVVSFWKKRRREMTEVNVRGTANLINMCLLRDPMPKFVHVSSIAALGRRKDTDLIDEASSWTDSRMNTHYAKTKYLAELEVQRGVLEGLPSVIANPGVIIGAGDWNQNTPQLFRIVDKGLRWYRGGMNGFVGAKDVARGLIELMKSEFNSGERFILVSENMSYKELLAQIAKSLMRRPPQRKAPPGLTRWIGIGSEWLAGMTGREPLISRETSRFTGNPFRYKGDKIANLTDFRYTPMAEVISAAAAEFRKSEERKN